MIIASNGAGDSFRLDFPTGQWLQNGSDPKIADDGPVSIDLRFEALEETTTDNTDVKCTIVTAEADITT